MIMHPRAWSRSRIAIDLNHSGEVVFYLLQPRRYPQQNRSVRRRLIAVHLTQSGGVYWSPPFFTGAPPQQKAAPLAEGGASHSPKKPHLLLHLDYSTSQAGAPRTV